MSKVNVILKCTLIKIYPKILVVEVKSEGHRVNELERLSCKLLVVGSSF